MLDIHLPYPVYNLEDELLLPAGTRLTEDVARELASHKKEYETASLLQFETVQKDLHGFFSTPPYPLIFRKKEGLDNILEPIKEVRVPLPILKALDYFKKHDFFTYRHIITVLALSTLLAKDIISDQKDMVSNMIAAPFHDIGKIAIPINILRKKTPLTAEELTLMRHHTIFGYLLLVYYLKDSESIIAKVARDHHEKLDGSGYIRGIKQDNALIEVVSICDIFDALISSRSYRPTPYDARSALEEITRLAEHNCIGWNPLKALVSHVRSTNGPYKEVEVSREKRGTSPADSSYGIIAENSGEY